MMVLKVKTYRAMDIDSSKLEVGDVLIVRFESGSTIHLLPVQDHGYHRWLYTKRSWLPGDRDMIRQLLTTTTATDSLGGPAKVETQDSLVDAYTPWHFRLDEQLHFGVEVAGQRNFRRSLGTFPSSGGRVTNVTASTVHAFARS
jgi:hypothetical protein